MSVETTFANYIRRPGIVGSTTPQIKLIEMDARQRYERILMREGGGLKFYQFKDDKNDTYYIHIKVPSEVLDKFYYDVIIKFCGHTGTESYPTLTNYNIQVFSNDPAFCYTYAYVFNKEGMLIKDFADKIGPDFLKSKPRERNPKETFGFVKSLYFAYFFMEQKKLFEKRWWDKAKPYKADTISHNIMKADSKIVKRQREAEQLRKTEKATKQTPQPPRNTFTGSDHVKPARVASGVRKTGTVKTTKTVRTTKAIRKR